MGIGVGDYDQDGDLDILLVNDCLWPDYIPTKLFKNNGLDPACTAPCDPTQDWLFAEVGVSEGLVEAPGTADCRNGMGIAVGDYDRNSKMDVYYSNVGDAVLFCSGHASGGVFRDSSAVAGVDGQAWPLFSWGTFFFDYDLDGWQDLFLSLGSHHYPSIEDPHPNMLYHNKGDGTFSDVSNSMGMNDDTRGRTVIYGDYDNDGDPDVLLANFGEAIQLKRNENTNGNHYLWVELEGTISNRDGIGSKLKLTAADNSVQYFETRSGSSLGGGDQIDAHFGLGTNTSILELEVTWPSGTVDVIVNPPIDTKLKLVEGVALDVSLASFTAHLNKENKVDLNWTTVSEENNDYFIVQHSIDGRTFSDLGKVEGNGTTSEVNQYSLVDPNPQKGVNYYRLKQVDFDASVTYSEIRQVAYRPDSDLLQVFPNPVSNELLQVVYNNTTTTVKIEVVNAIGMVLIQQTYDLTSDSGLQTALDLSELQAGIYTIVVEDGGEKHFKRVVKQH